MSAIRLQVMICTYGREGLNKVEAMELPEVEGVGYLVSCQSSPYALPEGLIRDDVSVSFVDSLGLSNNRNHALSLVTAPYALIADDDLKYYPDALKAIIDTFDRHPEVDIATFRMEYPHRVVYPSAEHDLSQPYKNYNIVSGEIALRTKSLHHSGIHFSPDLGIGAPFLKAAEENFFILSALRKGLKGRFFPVTIAIHDHENSTSHQILDPGVIRSNGAYVAIAYPFSAALRLPLIARRSRGSTVKNLFYLLQGAAYALRYRKKLIT